MGPPFISAMFGRGPIWHSENMVINHVHLLTGMRQLFCFVVLFIRLVAKICLQELCHDHLKSRLGVAVLSVTRIEDVLQSGKFCHSHRLNHCVIEVVLSGDEHGDP